MASKMCDCSVLKGRKLYERYCSWLKDNSLDFDSLSDDVKYIWTMTSLGKSKKVLCKDDETKKTSDEHLAKQPKKSESIKQESSAKQESSVKQESLIDILESKKNKLKRRC